jgi:hypothetical protein
VIRASDFTDNAVGIIHTTGPKLSKLAGKYGPLVPALRELILRPDTPLAADVKDMIAAQLDAAHERFAAIGRGRDGDSAASPRSGPAPGGTGRGGDRRGGTAGVNRRMNPTDSSARIVAALPGATAASTG